MDMNWDHSYIVLMPQKHEIGRHLNLQCHINYLYSGKTNYSNG